MVRAQVPVGNVQSEDPQFVLDGRCVEFPEGLRTAEFTHTIHRFPGKFVPQVARELLQLVGADKDTLIADPFCGSGTALTPEEGPEANDKGESSNGGRRIGKQKAEQVKAVFTVEQIAVVERAIKATGEKNRGEALVEICQAYLDGNANSERQFDFLAQSAAPTAGALRAE